MPPPSGKTAADLLQDISQLLTGLPASLAAHMKGSGAFGYYRHEKDPATGGTFWVPHENRHQDYGREMHAADTYEKNVEDNRSGARLWRSVSGLMGSLNLPFAGLMSRLSGVGQHFGQLQDSLRDWGDPSEYEARQKREYMAKLPEVLYPSPPAAALPALQPPRPSSQSLPGSQALNKIGTLTSTWRSGGQAGALQGGKSLWQPPQGIPQAPSLAWPSLSALSPPVASQAVPFLGTAGLPGGASIALGPAEQAEKTRELVEAMRELKEAVKALTKEMQDSKNKGNQGGQGKGQEKGAAPRAPVPAAVENSDRPGGSSLRGAGLWGLVGNIMKAVGS